MYIYIYENNKYIHIYIYVYMPPFQTYASTPRPCGRPRPLDGPRPRGQAPSPNYLPPTYSLSYFIYEWTWEGLFHDSVQRQCQLGRHTISGERSSGVRPGRKSAFRLNTTKQTLACTHGQRVGFSNPGFIYSQSFQKSSLTMI